VDVGEGVLGGGAMFFVVVQRSRRELAAAAVACIDVNHQEQRQLTAILPPTDNATMLYKKFELMLTGCAKAYSSSCS